MYDMYDLYYDFTMIPLAVSFDLAADCAVLAADGGHKALCPPSGRWWWRRPGLAGLGTGPRSTRVTK